jgi:hypothetical protein
MSFNEGNKNKLWADIIEKLFCFSRIFFSLCMLVFCGWSVLFDIFFAGDNLKISSLAKSNHTTPECNGIF